MRFILYISLFMYSSLVQAQDSHYSLYHHRHGGLNAALTGYGQEEAEVRTLYRTQWNSISPLTYLSLEAEKQDGLWGYGISWNKSGAGAGSLISNQIALGASKQVNINSDGFLRLGMQVGYYKHSLDWNGAVFETQHSSNGTLGSNTEENLTLNKASSVDLNAGLFFNQKAGSNTINLGFNLSHIAQNKLTLYIDGVERLLSKKTIHASVRIPIVNDWALTPSLLYQNQTTAHESILAISAAKKIEGNKLISLGTGIRLKDALIFQTEFQLENLAISMAYDVNISKLKAVGNGFGAFEIGLLFKFKEAKDYKETVNLRIEDTDNDGVADEKDECPTIPGNAHNRGCPGRADSDKDGIADEVDLCPGVAGSYIHGGCPDTDGDGVADIDDECPTLYGALHFQGCPDSDQDGISDKYDACPATFGLTTNKGCPDNKLVQPTSKLGEYLVEEVKDPETKSTDVLPIQSPKTYHKHSYQVNEFTNSRKTHPPDVSGSRSDIHSEDSDYVHSIENEEVIDKLIILFDKNESMLDFSDKKRLRDFINTSDTSKDIRIVLRGHTDRTGDELYNMELGYRRAESVKRYLAQFGLTDQKMLPLSYGEEMPTSSMNDENRRVEVLIIK